jgi:ATP-binding cassette, subfamily B, multidrug efflux pump
VARPARHVRPARQIFGHLQRLPLPYYDRNPVGRTMTRVTSDVEVLNELFSSGVVTIFGDVFTLLLIVAAMFVLDWQLALVTLAVMPFVFAVAIMFRRRIREAYRDVRVRLARINAFLQEHISGVAVVQLFGRERAAPRGSARSTITTSRRTSAPSRITPCSSPSSRC